MIINISKFLEIAPQDWKDELINKTYDDVLDVFENHNIDLYLKEYVANCEWHIRYCIDKTNYSVHYQSLNKDLLDKQEAFDDAIEFIKKYKIIEGW